MNKKIIHLAFVVSMFAGAFCAWGQAAALPRVLIIGDEIAVAYAAEVKTLLAGKAEVHCSANAFSTGYSKTRIKNWIGSEKWDLIYFNWGVHDIKYMKNGKQNVSPDAYEKNLKQLVGQLKKTGAKLVFATTTPIPSDYDRDDPRKNEDVKKYNEIALGVMNANKVAIDDLNAFITPKISYLQREGDYRFLREGYKALGKQVAATIENNLKK